VTAQPDSRPARAHLAAVIAGTAPARPLPTILTPPPGVPHLPPAPPRPTRGQAVWDAAQRIETAPLTRAQAAAVARVFRELATDLDAAWPDVILPCEQAAPRRRRRDRHLTTRPTGARTPVRAPVS
jgi:hypothetical protein